MVSFFRKERGMVSPSGKKKKGKNQLEKRGGRIETLWKRKRPDILQYFSEKGGKKRGEEKKGVAPKKKTWGGKNHSKKKRRGKGPKC